MRLTNCAVTLAVTLAVYFGAAAVLAIGFGALMNPVGVGKHIFFAAVYVPALLFLFGWAQGKAMLTVHGLASVFIWFQAWHLSATYDPNRFVGTLPKELAAQSLFSAALAYVLCATASALLNASRQWKGQAIELHIPFRRKPIVLGRS